MDNELLLFDRINVIKDTINKYGESNFYLSFSGGKDSTILHYLLDMALPNNKIPRVFIDTGIEYTMIREFVLGLAKNDNRFTILKPSKPIKQTLEKYGYPFKSKIHAKMVGIYQRNGLTDYVRQYVEGKNIRFNCRENLKYQFTKDFHIKIDFQCCVQMKEKPMLEYAKKVGLSINLTGMRKDEGGARENIKGCIITDRNGKIIKFHPLLVVNDNWENWFVKKYDVKLCKLYDPPYNFHRTGCKGCPFALDLNEQLEIMERYLPNEKAQCEIIWKPIYAEYRRLGYRLNRHEQYRLF